MITRFFMWDTPFDYPPRKVAVRVHNENENASVGTDNEGSENLTDDESVQRANDVVDDMVIKLEEGETDRVLKQVSLKMAAMQLENEANAKVGSKDVHKLDNITRLKLFWEFKGRTEYADRSDLESIYSNRLDESMED